MSDIRNQSEHDETICSVNEDGQHSAGWYAGVECSFCNTVDTEPVPYVSTVKDSSTVDEARRDVLRACIARACTACKDGVPAVRREHGFSHYWLESYWWRCDASPLHELGEEKQWPKP